jgi:two-component system nitrate/nitrite response regulator NarL
VLEVAPAPAGLRSVGLLVVDGHPVVRQGLRLFLGDGERVRILADAQSGEEAVRLACRLQPDVVLLDPWLADLLPADVIGRLRGVSPATRIVVFATHVTPTLREVSERLGVQGIVGKDTTAERLLDLIERVARGEIVTDPPHREALRRAADKLKCAPLTPREHEILCRAAHGESNAEIARAIYLAPTTVKSYLQSALRKLGARNRVEAVFKLSELRLL